MNRREPTLSEMIERDRPMVERIRVEIEARWRNKSSKPHAEKDDRGNYNARQVHEDMCEAYGIEYVSDNPEFDRMIAEIYRGKK
ncbi:MAG: hypothetical protein ABH824_06195 [Nanoarchaeota archaeon]